MSLGSCSGLSIGVLYGTVRKEFKQEREKNMLTNIFKAGVSWKVYLALAVLVACLAGGFLIHYTGLKKDLRDSLKEQGRLGAVTERLETTNKNLDDQLRLSEELSSISDRLSLENSEQKEKNVKKVSDIVKTLPKPITKEKDVQVSEERQANSEKRIRAIVDAYCLENTSDECKKGEV